MTAFSRFWMQAGARLAFFAFAGVAFLFAPLLAQGSTIQFRWEASCSDDPFGLIGSHDPTFSQQTFSGLSDYDALPVSAGARFYAALGWSPETLAWVRSRPAKLTLLDSALRLASFAPAAGSDLNDVPVDVGIAIVHQWSITAIDVTVASEKVTCGDGTCASAGGLDGGSHDAGSLDDSAAIGSPRAIRWLTAVSRDGRFRPRNSF